MKEAPEGYVSIPRLAKAMRNIHADTLYKYRKKAKGYLSTVTLGRLVCITMADACQLVKDWRRSLPPKEVPDLVPGFSLGSTWYYKKIGLIETVTIFGRTRIFRRSLPNLAAFLEDRQSRIEHPESRSFFARLSKEALREISKRRRPASEKERQVSSERMKRRHREGDFDYKKMAENREAAKRKAKGLVTALEAAEIFRLPVEQTRPILDKNYNFKRAKLGTTVVYSRTAVEKFANEKFALLERLKK